MLATAVAAALATLGRCLPALPGLPAGWAARSEPAMTDFQAFMAAQNSLACAMMRPRQHPGQLPINTTISTAGGAAAAGWRCLFGTCNSSACLCRAANDVEAHSSLIFRFLVVYGAPEIAGLRTHTRDVMHEHTTPSRPYLCGRVSGGNSQTVCRKAKGGGRSDPMCLSTPEMITVSPTDTSTAC